MLEFQGLPAEQPSQPAGKKTQLVLAQTQRVNSQKKTMARSAAPSDEENAVRAPDPAQRMRLVEPTQQIDDTFAWTDEARVQVAVQTTALLLASCVYCVGDEWRALALALVWGNASLALSAQRERRQPAPWLQVLLASITCVLASYASRDQIEACWKWVCVFAYAVEAMGWRRPTTDMI